MLDIKTLKSVYYAIFESHLWYASLAWLQNTSSVKRLHLLQKKSLRLMFFQVSKILKSFDKTALENCIFISKSLKGYCLLFSITGSNCLLSHTLMILDGQILVILKYPPTILKRMVDIQCLHIQYMFGITYKVAIKMLYFIR